MKRIVTFLLVAVLAGDAYAGQQYSSPALDNLTPGRVPTGATSMVYGYDGGGSVYHERADVGREHYRV